MFTTVVLTIGGSVVSNSTIHGKISIRHRENESSVMAVTLITTTGLQDLDAWAGKSALLVVDGVTMFTGKVDMPEIDVIYKKITLVCTDTRKEIINDQDISAIGYYSEAIFSEVEEVHEELTQRLETIPSAADILPNGTYALTDIRPEAIADITITDADIYRRKPTVSPTSRARLVNNITISFQFRYERLRHREREFQIGDNTFCEYMDQSGAIVTSKTKFQAYIEAMDWYVDESSIVYEDLPAGGWIDYCTGAFAWVNDYDYYALNVTFNSAIRYTQTITEDYTLTVTAPQSITQYGTIDAAQKNGFQYEYDSSLWESQKKYEAPTGLTLDTNDYYLDVSGTTEFDDVAEVAVNIAATKIIRSHRDTQVQFETDLRSDFNLTQTITVNTTILDATGKVTSIDHELDTASMKGNTITEISLSTAQGTQASDSFVAPTRPSVPVLADSYTEPHLMTLTLFGVGNIVTPSIEDVSRDEQIVTASQTYNVEIQDDNFGVTF